MISVARHYLSQTSYLTSAELANAMRGANGNLQGTFLKSGQQLTIPGVLDAPVAEKSIAVPKDFEARAIYLTGLMAGSDHGMKIVRRWREAGGNARGKAHDVPPAGVTIRLPKGSTRAVCPGCTAVVEPYSSIIAGPANSAPDPSEFRANIGQSTNRPSK